MNVPEDEDREFMARIALGDQEAFIALYARHRLRLRRYLWHHLGGDRELVEEAIQDVFLDIWRGAATFRGESRVLTWIFRITYRRMQHLRHATSRHHHQQLDHAAEDYFTREQLPTTLHENHVIERLTLDDAFQHLSAKHREILELIFEFGFSQEEVAKILAIPTGTVKSRISYARRALRQELAQSEEEAPSCQS